MAHQMLFSCRDCKDNKAVYQALKLENVFNLSSLIDLKVSANSHVPGRRSAYILLTITIITIINDFDLCLNDLT